MLAVIVFLACGASAPEIATVDPSEARVGDTVKVVGANFDAGTTVTIGQAPASTSIKGAALLEAEVPAGVAPGVQALVVSNPDGQSVSGSLTIAAPPAEVKICAGAYTAYSQLAASRKLIKIDRHPTGGGDKVSLEIGFRDIEAVEYEGRVMGEDYCSAIVLRLKSGVREVYEDSKELDLKKKSQELAQVVGRPVDVLHEDERPAE